MVASTTGEVIGTQADVCVLGAGPHGLAAALTLRQADPSLGVITVDPAGAWLSRWSAQMAMAGITTLRSPVVHSPSPDPTALARHIGKHQLPSSGLPYSVPTLESFSHFCDHLVAASGVTPPLVGQVRRVAAEPVPGGLVVHTDTHSIRARHLVIAGNPHRRRLPPWVFSLAGNDPDLIRHAADVDLRACPDLSGQAVVVVGGGLSAAHLALGAEQRGAEVTLLARRPLDVRSFDTDPGWLGPKYLDGFSREPMPANRLRLALEARGGGTIPPWMHDRVSQTVRTGRLEVRAPVEVRAAASDDAGRASLSLSDHSILTADHVWLATGTTPHIDAIRCLGDLAGEVPSIDGYPVLGDGLTLGDHPIHVMGRLATITLGPAAGNLWGAQRAARMIAASITGAPNVDATDARAAGRAASRRSARRAKFTQRRT